MVQKRLNDSMPFLPLVFTSNVFCTSTVAGEEGQQGIGEQQVKDCLKKLNVFKTFDQIRFT